MTVMAPERAAYSRMVLEHILANPELHDQANFATQTPCGTAHCIAGWAVELDADTDVEWYQESGRALNWRIRVNNRLVDIEVRAAHLLGLDWVSAHDLFYNMSNKSALKRFAKWIKKAEAAA